MNENIVPFPDRSGIEAEAAEWLIKLDGDRPLSREDRVALREWLQRSRSHREELHALAAHWDELNVLTELSVPLGKPPGVSKRRLVRSATPRFGWLGAAAVGIVVGIIAAGTIFMPPDANPFVAGNGLYATAVGQQKSTTLADGSIVMLNTDSQIEVDYGDRFRDVRLLRGEAHFTVATGASQPFRVFAGNERIEAVGTAFSVHLKDDAVSVAVTEGRVALVSLDRVRSGRPDDTMPPDSGHSQGSSAAIDDAGAEILGTLEAGQIATIKNAADAAANRISTLEDLQTIPLHDMSRRLSWREGILIFTGESLAEVVDEVSRYTSVSIEIPDPELRAMRIGGRFPIGETDTMLAVLETDFGIQTTRLDRDHVVLSGKIE